jgi:YegS/Rv2252/BmrU family lipid kinase
VSVAVIINPVSGGARPGAARLRAEVALATVERHGDHAEVFVTERAGHAREIARAAARRGVRLILAWGGDGTINEVASALAFDDVPLGVVPSGSGNGLAAALHVSRRPADAIAAALAAEPRPIDLGEVEGRLFVNVAGVGIDAYVAAQFNQAGNLRRGFATYTRLTGRALLSYAPEPYCINSEDLHTKVRALLISVANGPQFGNNARIAPGARVDDGLLDLVVVEERSRLCTILNLPRLFSGRADRVPGYMTARIRKATIESERPMTFHVDGEPVEAGTTLRVRVHPGALLVAA